MLFVRSQLLLSPNFAFLTLGAKSSKMSIFFLLNQNCDLSLKLNYTHQYESKGMLDFQNKASDIKLLEFHLNRDNNAYFEKHDFQRKRVY